MTDHDHAGHRPHDRHPPHDNDGDAALADLLDLDGQVLHRYWTEVISWVWQAATGTGTATGPGPGRILDLGAGTGTGTIALAQRFAGANVIAVDASEQMLSRIRAKALDLGLAERIRTVHADLDDGWPAGEPVDIAWASLSLHHLANPDRVLRDVLAATRPGGLMAVAEIAGPMRFLPHDLGFGRPGLEARCLDALKREQAHALPELGSHWATRLEAAGFTVLGERSFTIELDPPHPQAAASYAQQWLRRLRSGLAEHLAHDDLDVLATLIDGDGPEALQQREDLQIRGCRTGTLAWRA